MTRDFASKSSSATHTMTLSDTGVIEWCSCPAWRIQKPGKERDCPHARIVHAEQAAGQTSPGAPVVSQAPSRPVEQGVSGLRVHPPMLATAMTEDPRLEGEAFDAKFGRGGWLMEQKMDGHRYGFRVHDGSVWAYSRPRGDKPPTAKTLSPDMVTALTALGDGFYDGELVNPGGISSDVTRVGAELVAVLWDVVTLDGASVEHLTYAERRALLLSRLARLPEGQRCVSTVESVSPSWAGVEAIWQAGGEGVIVKRIDSVYQAGHRSADWLKVKEEGVAVGVITGWLPGSFGPHSVTLLTLDSGIETRVKTKNHATLADIAKDPARYLGARLVISHKGLLKSGSPRHGMWDHIAGESE